MVLTVRPLACFLVVAFALTGGCRSIYYDTMERFGKEKRHILVDRVEGGKEDQLEAQEQFKTTLERFKEVTRFDGEDLESLYGDLADELETCEARADDVTDRIGSIEQVAGDLFAEWETELEQISNASLRSDSRSKLDSTRGHYERYIGAMRVAESSMEPVLTAFRDQVLFLKHQLNARAIESLAGSVAEIEADVEALLADIQKAIEEADQFLAGLT